jgi:hypothetical protein
VCGMSLVGRMVYLVVFVLVLVVSLKDQRGKCVGPLLPKNPATFPRTILRESEGNGEKMAKRGRRASVGERGDKKETTTEVGARSRRRRRRRRRLRTICGCCWKGRYCEGVEGVQKRVIFGVVVVVLGFF